MTVGKNRSLLKDRNGLGAEVQSSYGDKKIYYLEHSLPALPESLEDRHDSNFLQL